MAVSSRLQQPCTGKARAQPLNNGFGRRAALHGRLAPATFLRWFLACRRLPGAQVCLDLQPWLGFHTRHIARGIGRERALALIEHGQHIAEGIAHDNRDADRQFKGFADPFPANSLETL